MTDFEKSIRLVEQGVAAGDYPCAALAIGQGEENRVRRMFGSVDGRMADFSLLFDMASLTKIFSTTLCALRMIEEGLLCLDDTLGAFFDTPTDKADITVRELMTHTSGLPAHIMLRDQTDSPDMAVSLILASPLEVPRGTQTIYSCMGYILLGKLLECIAGKNLDELAWQWVFQPLGMLHTGYLPKDPAAPTERDEGGTDFLRGVVHDENARFLGGVAGNAGVFSTLDDCIRLASMLAQGGETSQGRFLSPITLQTAIHHFTPGMSHNRGLGFKLAGGEADFAGDLFPRSAYGHTGFTGTSLLVDPVSGLYVVLLTNRVHPTRENRGLIRRRRLLHNCIMAEFSGSISEGVLQ